LIEVRCPKPADKNPIHWVQTTQISLIDPDRVIYFTLKLVVFDLYILFKEPEEFLFTNIKITSSVNCSEITNGSEGIC
jgi:hypothetical protein